MSRTKWFSLEYAAEPGDQSWMACLSRVTSVLTVCWSFLSVPAIIWWLVNGWVSGAGIQSPAIPFGSWLVMTFVQFLRLVISHPSPGNPYYKSSDPSRRLDDLARLQRASLHFAYALPSQIMCIALLAASLDRVGTQFAVLGLPGVFLSVVCTTYLVNYQQVRVPAPTNGKQPATTD